MDNYGRMGDKFGYTAITGTRKGITSPEKDSQGPTIFHDFE